MTVIDWIIVFAYACSTLALGWYFGRKQESTTEYFVGSGKMSPWLIGVSLFATLLSAISYLSIPGEVVGKGPVYLSRYIAFPFAFFVIAFVILPVYMRQQVTSAYELLEERLGISIRLLGVFMFLSLRLVWMSLLISLTAEAITTVSGIGEQWIPAVVVLTGVFAITYTSLGGLRAVVITDLLQTILLYGGALLVIGTITWKMDGFSWFPTEWQSEIWDDQPLFSLDPTVRVSVFGSILSFFLWIVCTSAGDQVTIQRFMATGDKSAARLAIAMQLTVGATVGLTLGLAGIALLGYFQANPELLPEATSLKDQADKVFPHFIGKDLPPIVSGLVVAGLFAAAMSSVDSGVNSITAVVLTDLLNRFGKKPSSSAKQVLFARLLAVAIGIAVVSLSTLVRYVPGNYTDVTNKTVNLLTVPIALLFFFALYVPFANATGVWIATTASVTISVLIAFSSYFLGATETGMDPISFMWISPAGLVAGVTVGLVACKVFDRQSSDSAAA